MSEPMPGAHPVQQDGAPAPGEVPETRPERQAPPEHEEWQEDGRQAAGPYPGVPADAAGHTGGPAGPGPGDGAPAVQEDDAEAADESGAQAEEGPRPLGLHVDPTGHAPVDAHLKRLEDADSLAVAGHIEVYEDVHSGLRETLAALDRPAPGPAPRAPGHPHPGS